MYITYKKKDPKQMVGAITSSVMPGLVKGMKGMNKNGGGDIKQMLGSLVDALPDMGGKASSGPNRKTKKKIMKEVAKSASKE